MNVDEGKSNSILPILYKNICRVKDINGIQDIDIMQFTSRILTFGSKTCSFKPKVLLISDVDDYECDNIGQLLSIRNIEYARINARYVPNDLKFSINIDGEINSCKVSSGSQSFECTDVKVVILRNFNIHNYQLHSHLVADALQKQEWQASIFSFFSVLNANFINDPEKDHRLKSVIFQLTQAKENGFSVPKTLISSNDSEIKDFIGNHPEKYIIKAIGLHHTIVNGIRYSYFSLQFDKIDKSLFKKDLTPLLIQELVPNLFELRVTFIGEDFFFTKIMRPKHNSNQIDYHYLKLDELFYSEFKVNRYFETKCRSFVKNIGLFYGSIDFVCPGENQFVFLEVNSIPDWQWLEKAHARSISETFVENINHLL